MKSLRYFFIVLAFSLMAGGAIAQPAAYQADYNRMMNHQFLIQMQMNRSMLYRHYDDLQTNLKFTFTVTMKDSSKKEVSSKIYLDTTLHKNYLILENKDLPKKDALRKKRIYANQTLNISREVNNYDGKGSWFITGMANDTCWMFKALSGSSINVYSFLSVDDNDYFEPASIAAIQQNNGPLLNLNKENLEPMIQGDEDAVKALLKKDYLKAIEVYNKHCLKVKKKAAKAGSH